MEDETRDVEGAPAQPVRASRDFARVRLATPRTLRFSADPPFIFHRNCDWSLGVRIGEHIGSQR